VRVRRLSSMALPLMMLAHTRNEPSSRNVWDAGQLVVRQGQIDG
jgi:hypothetical protein